MDSSISFLDFAPLAEFTDRFGEVRAIAGCSVLGRLEFWERIKQIHQVMADGDQTESWQSLYCSSKRLQHLVIRCLELNGIDPDWLSFDHLQQFLFHRWDEQKGEFQPGWLLEINSPSQTEGNGKSEPLSKEELVAAIAISCSNLKEALDLAQNLKPADFLLGTLEAQAELKDKDSRERKKRKKTAKKLRDELGGNEGIKKLLQTPIEELQQAATNGSV